MGCVIDFVKNTIEYEGTSKKMSAKKRDILEYLIRNEGNVVTYEQIYDRVWGFLADDADEHRLIKQQIYLIKKTFPILGSCIEAHDELGYAIHLSKNDRVIFEKGGEDNASNREPAEQVDEKPKQKEAVPVILPKVLTSTIVPYADETTAIHRSEDVEKLTKLLSNKKAAVMISGFGGLGKTTVARMLYSHLSDEFDSVGWVEYHGNLKDSLLASLSLYQELDDRELRWNAVYERLKNDRTKKLLFIDNVDRDKAHEQDPEADQLLWEISGWPNLSVVLTSRLDHIKGYRSYRLKMLEPEACEDLFFYYYDECEYEIPGKERSQRDIVKALVELAGYHTYAVELLAKSAKYTSSLKAYLNDVRKAGFRFPTLNVQTDHRNASANAAEQLRKLFDMSTRSEAELQILWDFSVLPNIELTMEEVEQWLGYTANDLDQLIREGWLLFRQGCSMHPLIKETMHLDLVDGKAPKGTMEHLISQIVRGEFLPEAAFDTFAGAKRKLDVAEHALKMVAIDETDFPGCLEWCLAECYDYVGYFLSYTNTGRKEGEGYLRNELRLRRHLESLYPGYYRAELASCCDKLGYLLSDQEEKQQEAESLLLEALTIRKSLEEDHPDKYISDVAWTMDNLGYLLSSIDARRKEAEVWLKKALNIRRKLEQIDPEDYAASTEVQWTYNNLGQLLQSDENRFEEAEMYYRLALEHHERWESRNCVWEYPNLAITWNNLATLLQKREHRAAEAEKMYREALEIMRQAEDERKGMYPVELLISCHNLAVFLRRTPEGVREAEILQNEIRIMSEALEWTYPGVFGEFLSELKVDTDSFYIQSGSRKQKVKARTLEKVLTQ